MASRRERRDGCPDRARARRDRERHLECTLGGEPRRRDVAASTAADTCAPKAPPAKRTIEFIPMATLVWVSGTQAITWLASDEYALPRPTPTRALASATCQVRRVPEGEQCERAEVRAAPGTIRRFGPTRGRIRPTIMLVQSIDSVSGTSSSEPPVDRGAEAVPREAGRLGELRDQHEAREEAEADEERTAFAVQTPRSRRGSHVHERVGHPQLHRGPDGEAARTEREQPEHPRRAPAPRRRLADAQQDRDQPGGQEDAPSQSTGTRSRLGESGTTTKHASVATAIGASGSQKSQWYDRWSVIGPESTMPRLEPVPTIPERVATPATTRVLGNSSRMIPTDSGKSAPPAPWITRPISSCSIDVPSAQTSVPARNAPEHDDQEQPLAEDVAEAAEDGRRHAGREEVARQHPGYGRRRRVHVLLDLEQSRRDERLHQRVREDCGDERAERQPVVRPLFQGDRPEPPFQLVRQPFEALKLVDPPGSAKLFSASQPPSTVRATPVTYALIGLAR